MKQGYCRIPRLRDAAMLVLMGVAAGCGRTDDLPRQPISGNVSFDGKPLTKAWIEFRPEGEGGITTAGAMINDGSYYVPLDSGLVPGKYRVAIKKAEECIEGAAESEPSSAPLPKRVTRALKLQQAVLRPLRYAKQLIPARYNTKSELIQEVKADQSNNFNFELTSN